VIKGFGKGADLLPVDGFAVAGKSGGEDFSLSFGGEASEEEKMLIGGAGCAEQNGVAGEGSTEAPGLKAAIGCHFCPGYGIYAAGGIFDGGLSGNDAANYIYAIVYDFDA